MYYLCSLKNICIYLKIYICKKYIYFLMSNGNTYIYIITYMFIINVFIYIYTYNIYMYNFLKRRITLSPRLDIIYNFKSTIIYLYTFECLYITKYICIYLCVYLYFWGPYSVPFIYACVLSLILHFHNHCRLIVSLNSVIVNILTLFFSFNFLIFKLLFILCPVLDFFLI